MKKLLTALLCTCMITSVLAGCSDTNKGEKETTAATVENSEASEATTDATASEETSASANDSKSSFKLYNAFLDQLENTSDIEEIAAYLGSEDVCGYDCGTMAVEEGLLNGFNGEVKGFSKGIVFSPYIGSIPFIGYIFESDDPAALKEELLTKCDLRWNICTEADETLCEVKDGYVFFVMCPAE